VVVLPFRTSSSWKPPPGDDQLIMAREIGMIFGYMNLDPIWQSFCATYNGILTLLTEFDQWYPTYAIGSSSNLAGEWPLFIRSELDNAVTSARANLNSMVQKKSFAGAAFAIKWATMQATSFPTVKLSRTDICKNLPSSTLYP